MQPAAGPAAHAFASTPGHPKVAGQKMDMSARALIDRSLAGGECDNQGTLHPGRESSRGSATLHNQARTLSELPAAGFNVALPDIEEPIGCKPAPLA